jgi:hypothetical protein
MFNIFDIYVCSKKEALKKVQQIVWVLGLLIFNTLFDFNVGTRKSDDARYSIVLL